ncbi:TfoX/Sxy family protein [Dyella subtropica]|uniref:TfoX/Sxy family protein n=1 Tax=Dyella subtropica TaxID=2992127 RepID=UPI00225AF462|nr:TfoX/Sxy family protein [Dyella subtropica]
MTQGRASKTNLASEYVAYIADQLSAHREVQVKRFFGGVALLANNIQFAIIMKDTLYFCVHPDNRQHYLDRGMGPFTYQTAKGTVSVQRYYEVPADILEDSEILASWMDIAMVDARQ